MMKHMNAKRVLIAAGMAIGLQGVAAVAAITDGTGDGVTTDLFDVAQGTKVFEWTAPYSGTDNPRNALGGTYANVNGVSFIFSDANTPTDSISFRTAAAIDLTSYQFRLFSDGPGSTLRSIKDFKLYASSDNITYVLVDGTAVASPYNTNPGVTTSQILISGSSTVTQAQFFRLEVQRQVAGIGSGPRIGELDGFGTASATPFGGLVRDPIVFNAAANNPNSQDQDPGYANNFASSAKFSASEPIENAFGDNTGGINPTAFLFVDGGTADNGNSTMGDGGETVRFISWNTTQPFNLAGIRLALGPDNPTSRAVQLVRFSVDGTPVIFTESGSNILDLNAFSGWKDLLFPSVTGDSFKIDFTGTSDGPRIGEIDALILPVPEPATLSLLGLGALAILRRRRW